MKKIFIALFLLGGFLLSDAQNNEQIILKSNLGKNTLIRLSISAKSKSVQIDLGSEEIYGIVRRLEANLCRVYAAGCLSYACLGGRFIGYRVFVYGTDRARLL